MFNAEISYGGKRYHFEDFFCKGDMVITGQKSEIYFGILFCIYNLLLLPSAKLCTIIKSRN